MTIIIVMEIIIMLDCVWCSVIEVTSYISEFTVVHSRLCKCIMTLMKLLIMLSVSYSVIPSNGSISCRSIKLRQAEIDICSDLKI